MLFVGSSSASSQVLRVPDEVQAAAGAPGSPWLLLQSALLPSLAPVNDVAAFTDPSGSMLTHSCWHALTVPQLHVHGRACLCCVTDCPGQADRRSNTLLVRAGVLPEEQLLVACGLAPQGKLARLRSGAALQPYVLDGPAVPVRCLLGSPSCVPALQVSHRLCTGRPATDVNAPRLPPLIGAARCRAARPCLPSPMLQPLRQAVCRSRLLQGTTA